VSESESPNVKFNNQSVDLEQGGSMEKEVPPALEEDPMDD